MTQAQRISSSSAREAEPLQKTPSPLDIAKLALVEAQAQEAAAVSRRMEATAHFHRLPQHADVTTRASAHELTVRTAQEAAAARAVVLRQLERITQLQEQIGALHQSVQ